MKKYPILILSCVMMTSIYAEDKKSFDIFKAEYNKKLLQFNSTSEQQQEKIRKLENTIQGQYKKFNEQLIIQQTEHQKQVEHLIQNLDELKNEQRIKALDKIFFQTARVSFPFSANSFFK